MKIMDPVSWDSWIPFSVSVPRSHHSERYIAARTPAVAILIGTSHRCGIELGRLCVTLVDLGGGMQFRSFRIDGFKNVGPLSAVLL